MITVPLHHTQPCPDPAPCRRRSWFRNLRRWFNALRARTGTYIAEDVDNHELARVEDYANGSRRLMLYTTVGVDDWKTRRDQVENALSQALIAAGLATPARSLRLHGGTVGRSRLQCWGIPGPHGPEVLEELAGLLAIAHELGLGQDVHVCSD
ncbi:hypothetical protein [Saccharopolyspora sp. NPDC049357]|uniref:hypothetical protein n=1 Tax=Saccharopolyspora sp. NPDC049357 TaxID=3154507 RepID=UPI00344629E3